MEVRDPIHGSINILKEEEDILFNPFFQRLRNIKQLGFSEFSFPGATHTRYLHALGVMKITGRVFDHLFPENTQTTEHKRLKETLRLAGLLHDIGHAPLSHASESVMPMLSSLKLPNKFHGQKNHDRQADHEDYTLKTITDSSFTPSLSKIQNKFGIKPDHIASLITGECLDEGFFSISGINYFPLMHQLISSELDCDRMDYLLRDSHFTGVSYGIYDLDWICQNIRPAIVNNTAYMGISERAVSTFDDFLLSRFHMFITVYFHYRSVCLEKMLYNFFSEAPHEYQIPANIEEYLEHDDHYLTKILRNSSNEWAQRIINNDIPHKVYESYNQNDLRFQKLEHFLTQNKLDFIKCSSKGRLSKYYSEDKSHNKHSMYVIKQYPIDGQKLLPISQATNLYQKYSQSHELSRFHCDIDQFTPDQQLIIKKIIQTPND